MDEKDKTQATKTEGTFIPQKNKSIIFSTVQPSNNDASDENSEFAGQDALDKALREKEWRSTISKYKFI